jgi:peptidoglycan/xylan/chitin deacetylase (PgdA/CDA1 family)
MRRLKRPILFLLICALLLAVGGIYPSAEVEVIYRHAAQNGRLCIALTFDDGPHPKYTPQILDILAEYQVPATFFAVGENIRAYPAVAKRIVAEGHELGNHTFHHCHLSGMDAVALKQEVLSCKKEIEEITGAAAPLLRPPEGVCTPELRTVCEELGLTIILWSVDTRDWAHTPQPEILQNVKSNTKNGSIILMHDFIGQKSPTPAALRKIIPMLLESGYEFVTVSQLLATEGL